ncbi:hypothetical protein B0O99DRAFT_625724 [Bisporella sp. PMI_857]|nr:hypothetical protein B0O99DRAFT_625724 [Bisporella sp. PMI_857]
MNIYDRFALSAKPDYFVTADHWSKQDQNRIHSDKKHYDDVIQRLEYSHTHSNEKGGNDGLPQYIFQLSRLVLPISEPDFAYKLPFLAVVDVLDPRKAVWLVHVGDIAEDSEEGRDWYPPRYVLDQIACFFNGSNRREPANHIAQVAPSLEEWMDARLGYHHEQH